jgi:hypothetical protein
MPELETACDRNSYLGGNCRQVGRQGAAREGGAGEGDRELHYVDRNMENECREVMIGKSVVDLEDRSDVISTFPVERAEKIKNK